MVLPGNHVLTTWSKLRHITLSLVFGKPSLEFLTFNTLITTIWHFSHNSFQWNFTDTQNLKFYKLNVYIYTFCFKIFKSFSFKSLGNIRFLKYRFFSRYTNCIIDTLHHLLRFWIGLVFVNINFPVLSYKDIWNGNLSNISIIFWKQSERKPFQDQLKFTLFSFVQCENLEYWKSATTVFLYAMNKTNILHINICKVQNTAWWYMHTNTNTALVSHSNIHANEFSYLSPVYTHFWHQYITYLDFNCNSNKYWSY